MASLRIVGTDGTEKLVELRERKLQIGRGRDNDVILADDEKGVSRTHAELRFENGRYVVVDLQSQNGTWVNGRRVDRAEVPAGAEIVIGDYRLTIQSESAAAGANVTAGSTIVRPVRDLGDLHIRERVEPPPYRQHVPPPSVAAHPSPQRNWALGVVLAVLAIVVFAAAAWVWAPGGGQASGEQGQPAAKSADGAAPGATPAPAPADPPPADRTPEATEPYAAKPNSPRRPPDRKV